MNFYFYLWLLKILWPDNTSSHISRHLEFIIEHDRRVNWVSGSLNSRVTGSLGHKIWPSSISDLPPNSTFWRRLGATLLTALDGDGAVCVSFIRRHHVETTKAGRDGPPARCCVPRTSTTADVDEVAWSVCLSVCLCVYGGHDRQPCKTTEPSTVDVDEVAWSVCLSVCLSLCACVSAL